MRDPSRGRGFRFTPARFLPVLPALMLLLLPGAAPAEPPDDPSPVGRLLSQVFDSERRSIVRIVSYRATGPFPQAADGLGRLSRLEPNRRTLWSSGVVLAGSGEILTCAEAAQPGDSLVVCTTDGHRSPARFVAQDALMGVALIQTIEPLPFAPIRRPSASICRPGDWLLVLSFCGSQSSPSLHLGTWAPSEGGRGARSPFLRVELADCAGLCGGAVIDGAGAFRGMIVSPRVVREGEDGPRDPKEGIRVMECDGAWAVKSAALDSLRLRLLDSSRSAVGFLGVQAEVDTTRTGDQGLRQGILRVVDVFRGSPAETAGVLPEDRILTINGQPVRAVDEINRFVTSSRPGTEIRLGLLRRGAPLTLTARLVDRSTLDWFEREAQLDQLRQRKLQRSLQQIQDRLRWLEAAGAAR